MTSILFTKDDGYNVAARVASTRGQILETLEPQITARALELLQRRRR